jgi:transketolase
MALHGGLRIFGGTFLTFTDYLRPSLRLACLMGLPTVYVMTHDSIGLGEDGPTHQPVEHLAALRAIPNLHVLRPADATETVGAWRSAIARTDGPTLLALSRQDLPVLEGTDAEEVHRGAYRVVDVPEPDIVLVATGSEVHLAADAATLLSERGVAARVVSMPSWELFEVQDDDYQETVLPGAVPVLSVEAATSFGWSRWADDHVAIDHFGASAPAGDLFDEFGFTPEAVAEAALDLLQD